MSRSMLEDTCENVAAADNHVNNDSRQITRTFVIYSDLYVMSNNLLFSIHIIYIDG